MHCHCFCGMRKGPRHTQQDCLQAGDHRFQFDDHQQMLAFDRLPKLLMVGDGMGGHDRGEAASRFACRRLWQTVGQDGVAADQDQVVDGLIETHRASLQRLPKNSGTTVAGVVLFGRRMVGFNLGDSRVYCRDNGCWRYVSHDHSPVQELVDRRLISTADTIGHPYGHLVSAGIGPVFGERWTPMPYIWESSLVADEWLLICSDGVSDRLTVDQFASLPHRSPEAFGEGLLEQLDRSGLQDNASFIVALLSG